MMQNASLCGVNSLNVIWSQIKQLCPTKYSYPELYPAVVSRNNTESRNFLVPCESVKSKLAIQIHVTTVGYLNWYGTLDQDYITSRVRNFSITTLRANVIKQAHKHHGITFYTVTPRIRKGTNLSDEGVPLIIFLYEYKAQTKYVLLHCNNFKNVWYSDLKSGHSPLAVSEITLLLRMRPGRASFGGIIAEMK